MAAYNSTSTALANVNVSYLCKLLAVPCGDLMGLKMKWDRGALYSSRIQYPICQRIFFVTDKISHKSVSSREKVTKLNFQWNLATMQWNVKIGTIAKDLI